MSIQTATPELIEESVNRLTAQWNGDTSRRDFDMDDGPDFKIGEPQGRLAMAVAFLQLEVWPAFNKTDHAAMRHQQIHQRLTELAAVSGALAVLFGVVQLVYPSLAHWHWVGSVEVCVAAAALLVVVIGLRASIQNNWLLERCRAERLRHHKFALLIHQTLWSGPFEVWQRHVREVVSGIHQMDQKTMEAWAVQDRVPMPVKNTEKSSLETEQLHALAGYYIAKRLTYQMTYFRRRSQHHSGRDRLSRHWPSWCFYGSVSAVAFHYLLDILPWRLESEKWVSSVCLLLAFALPVIGACIRTLRFARESGRSAALFHAKHDALENLLRRITDQLDAVPVRPGEVLQSLAACEDFLEAEQHEWLRLMRDAEWFG